MAGEDLGRLLQKLLRRRVRIAAAGFVLFLFFFFVSVVDVLGGLGGAHVWGGEITEKDRGGWGNYRMGLSVEGRLEGCALDRIGKMHGLLLEWKGSLWCLFWE